jgi:hypothetical protein
MYGYVYHRSMMSYKYQDYPRLPTVALLSSSLRKISLYSLPDE